MSSAFAKQLAPVYSLTLQVVDELKIKGQNDKELLKEAKDRVYQAGFYQGVMLMGKYAGKKVFEAKNLVRADMLAEGTAALYWEPESEVISRSGDECVVAELDQWYLKYGEDDWRAAVEAWVKSPSFKTYTAATLSSFEGTLAWLKEWACSRSFGLGTRLPWDPQFVIESLSDSTIYMAYYTVAHLLQGGEIDPHKNGNPGPLGIRAEDLSEGVWEYVFLDGPYPDGCKVPREHLDVMRREFDFWYPMDLRVSGKDLINNHLTMALYNHAAMWGARADRMPQSFFCNGHVLVDGEKMAKQKGNFVTLTDAIARWGADATRFALADAGDGLEDANFEQAKADIAILRLTTEEEYVVETLAAIRAGSLRTGAKEFVDLYVRCPPLPAAAYKCIITPCCAVCLSPASTSVSPPPRRRTLQCVSERRCKLVSTSCSWTGTRTVTTARSSTSQCTLTPSLASLTCKWCCWPPSARTFATTCGSRCWGTRMAPLHAPRGRLRA
jgi:leucyl-tRNA synthetase